MWCVSTGNLSSADYFQGKFGLSIPPRERLYPLPVIISPNINLSLPTAAENKIYILIFSHQIQEKHGGWLTYSSLSFQTMSRIFRFLELVRFSIFFTVRHQMVMAQLRFIYIYSHSQHIFTGFYCYYFLFLFWGSSFIYLYCGFPTFKT